MQCGEHAKREAPATAHVPHREAHIHGVVAGVAGHAHRAAERLHDAVERGTRGVWAVLSEPGERGRDDGRVDLLERLVVYPQAFEDAGAEVVQHHVRLRGERVERLASEVGLEVERDAALVAVEAEEVGALAVQEVGAELAGGVTGAGLLDLDDVRAEVGEQASGERPAEDGGELQDADVFQRHAHRPASNRKSPEG